MMSVMNDNGETILRKEDIANEFKTVYIEMGKKMADSLNRDREYISYKLTILNSTDSEELRIIIEDLKSKKSTGVDEIQVNTIKDIAEFILEPLTYITNLSMKTVYKEAVVVPPIYKKWDDKRIMNFRPISLISNLTKIFEKVVKTNSHHITDKQ